MFKNTSEISFDSNRGKIIIWISLLYFFLASIFIVRISDGIKDISFRIKIRDGFALSGFLSAFLFFVFNTFTERANNENNVILVSPNYFRNIHSLL